MSTNPVTERPSSTAQESPAVAIYDCWNKIGISGDNSCPELEKFVHCRNCPVYLAAGTRLLDHELPANYRREWTELFSKKKPTATPGALSGVIFRIAAERLALPTSAFQEVVEQRTIHSLPHRRQGIVLGLTNIRGELLICVSLGRLIGLTPEVRKVKPQTTYDRLLVMQWNGSRFVFPVDEVYGVQRYHPQELKEVPATLAKNTPNYTHGILSWRNTTVGCLDEELLFYTLNRSLT
jgi:chemotaxis-related protein WspD